MNSLARINLYSIFLFITLLNFSFPLFGQDNLQFNGAMQIGNYQGIADYTFKIDQKDTVLHGNFSMQSFNQNVLNSKEKGFFSIDGLFKAGFPDNTWSFRFGDFRPEEGAEFKNYHFNVKVSGTFHTAIVNFEFGKPDGEWIHSIREIENSKVEKTSFVSSSMFEDGIARGYLRIKNDSLTLLGRFLNNGLAHDIWELNFYKELGRMETWFFSDGRLEKIAVHVDENTEEFLIYQEEITRPITVNLDHRYLKILGLQNLYNKKLYENEGGKIAHLIKKNASYYQKIETILTNINDNKNQASKPRFSVKVAHYPLDEAELKQVDILTNNLQEIDSISQYLIGNTGLNIIKHLDEEVMYLLSTLQEISENYIRPARRIAELNKENLLAFLPRDELQWTTEYNHASVTEIKVSYQDSSGLKTRTFIGPAAENLNIKKTGIPYLLDLSEYTLSSVKAIEETLAKKTKQYSIKKELEDLEKELLKEEDSLIILVDSLKRGQENVSIIESLQSLKRTAIKELAQYATEENLIVKPKQARLLIECMKTLQVMALTLDKQPARWNEIKELYTEQVWNPFTATIMNDQVKQRLTYAYSNVLVPYLHQQIENNLTCENSERYLNLLNQLYNKMLALRKLDTSKLERKLKNEKDPQVVLQLIKPAM